MFGNNSVSKQALPVNNFIAQPGGNVQRTAWNRTPCNLNHLNGLGLTKLDKLIWQKINIAIQIETRQGRISVPELAQSAECCEASVYAALIKLKAGGLVLACPQPGKTTIYSLPIRYAGPRATVTPLNDWRGTPPISKGADIKNAHARQTPEEAYRKEQNTPTKTETKTETPEVEKTEEKKTKKNQTATMPDADAREAAAVLKTCPGFNHAYALRLARIYSAARIHDAYAAWYGGTWDDPPAALADAVVKGWRPSRRQRAAMPKRQNFQSPAIPGPTEIPSNSSQPGAPKPTAPEWKRPDDWQREELMDTERADMAELGDAIKRAATAKAIAGPGRAGGENDYDYKALIDATRAVKPRPSDDFADWQRRCEAAGRLVPVRK